MAARKRQRLDDQLELPQILSQAKHRWLRPAEIFEVLQNHSRFCLSEPADKPSSGSLYLYDRNVLRSFRKDGYRWKKTKDGKAVKEAHERLKAGGVEALHCYYAHGEENENFQRRCYWMIEEPLSHIVLVHYREVKTSEGNLSCSSKLSINWNMHSDTAYHASTSFPGGVNADELLNSLWPPWDMNFDKQNDSSVHRHSDKQNDPRILKNLDSSDQCMNAELGDLTELQMSSSRDHLSTIVSENGNDGSGALQPVQIAIPGPSLLQDRLFNIIDLSPNWAYENSETEVLVVGKFLKNQELESFKWSCMFGEVEVPTEVVADGVLRCYTPVHRAARIPFYVTRSNRLPCSEVRIFEYRVNQIQDADFKDDGCEDDTLVMRFGRILSPSFTYSSFNPQDKYRQYDPISVVENSDLTSKISSLLKNGNEERAEMLKLFPDEFSLDTVKAQLLQQFLKDKFHVWLLQKLGDGGNGFRVLDEGGQGVLHVGAALGYDWVFLPMTMAGVTVNFRDVNGWTALHWAAFRGRESAVSLLIGLGAAPEALTDPCTKSPTGKTPADLASEKGYKGIAAYLSSLISDINDANSAESSREKLVQPVPERIPASSSHRDLADGLSMRAHITGHQVKKNYGMGRAVRTVGMILRWRRWGKRRRLRRLELELLSEGPYNISYGFLKIQAHVTGHQVKKNYGMGWAVRTVGMILHWRGRGKRRRLRWIELELFSESPYDYDSQNSGSYNRSPGEENYGMGRAVRTVGMILRWRGRGKRRRLRRNFGPLADQVKDGSRNFHQQSQQQIHGMQSQLQPQHQNRLHQQILRQMRRSQPSTPRAGMDMVQDRQWPVQVKIEAPSELPMDSNAFNSFNNRHPQLQFRQQQIPAMSNPTMQNVPAQSGNQFRQISSQIAQIQSQNAGVLMARPVMVEAFQELMGADASSKHHSDENRLTSSK